MYDLDFGLIMAAERASGASHAITALLKEYRWWADFANKNPKIEEASISADGKASALRRALVANAVLLKGWGIDERYLKS